MSECAYCIYNVDGICTADGGVFSGEIIIDDYEDVDCLMYIDNAMAIASTDVYEDEFFFTE